MPLCAVTAAFVSGQSSPDRRSIDRAERIERLLDNLAAGLPIIHVAAEPATAIAQREEVRIGAASTG